MTHGDLIELLMEAWSEIAMQRKQLELLRAKEE